MRNIAFSILLFALAVVQIAVVTAELPKAPAQTAVARNVESGTHVVLASKAVEHKTSSL